VGPELGIAEFICIELALLWSKGNKKELAKIAPIQAIVLKTKKIGKK
jgi:hypothetical protein